MRWPPGELPIINDDDLEPVKPVPPTRPALARLAHGFSESTAIVMDINRMTPMIASPDPQVPHLLEVPLRACRRPCRNGVASTPFLILVP